MSSVRASFIRFKLNFLEKQRDGLKSFCNNLDKVLRDGKAWVDDRNECDMSYEDINDQIEAMIFYFPTQGMEDSVSSRPPKPSSEEQTLQVEGASASPQPQQSSTPTESLPKAGPMHQTYDSVVRHETGERIPGCVKQILSRLDVMEAAFSNLKTSTEKTSETQIEIQTQIEKIKQNHSQMEEQQTKQLSDIEKKVKKMGKHSEGMKQQEKRVSSLEKEMEAVKQRDERLTTLESEIQTLKKQEKRVTSLEKASVAVTSQLHQLEEKTFRKIDKVERQVDVNTDMIYHVKSRTESLSTKAEATDTAVEDLSNRMNALSTSHGEDSKKLETLEQKTTNIARKINRYQKTTEKKLDEVKVEFKAVCHLVANRLLPLERLRAILNQKIKGRDENVKKLGEVSDKVVDLEQKITDLGNKGSTPVGFSVFCPWGNTPVSDYGEIINSFTRVRYNFGNHYDCSTGFFTSPVDGVYVVYCCLDQVTDGEVHVEVVHHLVNPGPNSDTTKLVCLASSKVKDHTNGCFGVVSMSVGDTLCVKVWKKTGNELSPYSSFSCVKIS